MRARVLGKAPCRPAAQHKSSSTQKQRLKDRKKKNLDTNVGGGEFKERVVHLCHRYVPTSILPVCVCVCVCVCVRARALSLSQATSYPPPSPQTEGERFRVGVQRDVGLGCRESTWVCPRATGAARAVRCPGPCARNHQHLRHQHLRLRPPLQPQSQVRYLPLYLPLQPRPLRTRNRFHNGIAVRRDRRES